ncbi:hypothetical protein AB0D38_04675 [Streptomyces sp. NPDC048279]|jgi:hypothetical protein|uniref:hypothetical protein n=1 Tax=Streptomyces sp. NPDC048279 TaxID=3154714 RepID=UPI00341F27D9
MGGEIKAHGAVAGESSTSAGDAEPPSAQRAGRAFSWRGVAGKAAGAAVVLAVAADRLGLHSFLFCARVAVRAYSWFGPGH